MARRKRSGRNVDGILLLDKSIGVTSNGALQEAKRLFRAAKAGHTGNLDPLASGMLPLCFGQATRMSAFLLDADKRYHAVITLGTTTTTADSDGEVLETRTVPTLDLPSVEAVLHQFRGPIEQIPPMYSAIKHKGKPLYELAREGIEVERKPRAVVIHALDLVGIHENELEVTVHCSKGTYIRTLAEDIGERIGCGAHVSSLRRLAVGPFVDQDRMVTLEQVRDAADDGAAAVDALLLPLEAALADKPAVHLGVDSAFYIGQGQPVVVPKAPSNGLVRLFQGDTDFLGVGEVLDDGRVAPRRLVVR